MSDSRGPGLPGASSAADDLSELAQSTAAESRAYLMTVREVAAGVAADTAIPVLLLALSQILVTGARLGAITDVVPDERFEADPGPDVDVDPLRHGMADILEGIDEYADLVDPVTSLGLSRGSVSGDVADIAVALTHGLRHYDQGRVSEALWWWQFSYLSSWGERAATALRVLQRVLGHLRLDADEEAVSDAEFDALHP